MLKFKTMMNCKNQCLVLSHTTINVTTKKFKPWNLSCIRLNWASHWNISIQPIRSKGYFGRENGEPSRWLMYWCHLASHIVYRHSLGVDWNYLRSANSNWCFHTCSGGWPIQYAAWLHNNLKYSLFVVCPFVHVVTFMWFFDDLLNIFSHLLFYSVSMASGP